MKELWQFFKNNIYEVFSLQNEGVIAVFPKMTSMTSRDRKCVGVARRRRHAVRILLAIILVFTVGNYFNLYLKFLAPKYVFCKTHVCGHL